MDFNQFGAVLFIVIFIGMIGLVFVILTLSRRQEEQRKNQIHASKTAPVKKKNAPILIRGSAYSPNLVLPTTGEHVAFYGLFIMSRESAITTAEGNVTYVGGIQLNDQYVYGTDGFRFFETSGDFSVLSEGNSYIVSISSLLTQFAKGASMSTSFAAKHIISHGVSEKLFNDTMTFNYSKEALKIVFGLLAPIKEDHVNGNVGSEIQTIYNYSSVGSVTSAIDARTQQYLVGSNLPQGILDLITKRGIVLQNNKEVLIIETFIPLNKDVFVFGTYDGEHSIVASDAATRLSVSYLDPELI